MPGAAQSGDVRPATLRACYELRGKDTDASDDNPAELPPKAIITPLAPMNSPPAPELRGAHPRWGPRRLAYELAKAAVAPVPSLSTIYRVLVRHGMVEDGELLATVPRHIAEARSAGSRPTAKGMLLTARLAANNARASPLPPGMIGPCHRQPSR